MPPHRRPRRRHSSSQNATYARKLKKYLPTLTYVLTQKKITPQLIGRLDNQVLYLLRDIIRNCVDPKGALYTKNLSDPSVCKCRKQLRAIGDASNPKDIQATLQQKGKGIALPLALLASSIPSLIQMIRGH